MKIQLLPPASWDDFETLAFQLWRAMWNDHNAMRHGRSGQPQHGVDIYGCPMWGRQVEGVQCKGKDNLTHKKLTKRELRAEVKKATEFKPRLSSFVMATTAPRDVAIQAEARSLSAAPDAPFHVSVWSWDDISSELNLRDDLMRSLYPSLFGGDNQLPGSAIFQNKIYIYRHQQLNRSFDFLTHPEVARRFTVSFRIELRMLLIELAMNAFEHGQATRVEFELSESGSFKLTDDGLTHNPLVLQDANRGCGASYLFEFQKRYSQMIVIEHTGIAIKGNEITFRLIDPVGLSTPISSLIVLDNLDIALPSQARAVAQSVEIPQGCDIVELQCTSLAFGWSSLVVFLHELVERLPLGVNLRIHVSEGDILYNLLMDFASSPYMKGRILVG